MFDLLRFWKLGAGVVFDATIVWQGLWEINSVQSLSWAMDYA